MKIIPKDQLDERLGKRSAWFPKRAVGLTYLSGIEEFDALKVEKPNLPAHFDIILRPEGLELAMMYGFKSYPVGVSFADIKAVELKLPEEIVSEKERSVLGRAVIGGLLLGPAGAIVGGMSGLQKGKEVEYTEAFFTLAVVQDGQEFFIVGSRKKGMELNTLKQFVNDNLKKYT